MNSKVLWGECYNFRSDGGAWFSRRVLLMGLMVRPISW